jgi:hypothetical protein
MAFYDKYIPNELKKVGSEAVDFIRSGSQKLVPKEIRKFLPYLAAAAPYTNIMFPGSGFFSGAIGRGLLSSLYNVAGQAAADPEGEDINALSALLAGAQGFGATPGAGDTLRGFTTKGQIADKGITGIQADRMMQGRGFFDKAADLGITGTAKVADFLGGAKDTLGKLGAGEKVGIETSKKVKDKIVKDTIMRDLFTKEGAKAAGKALTPMLAQGSADTAKAFADEALRNFEAAEAADLAAAGLSETEMMLARRNAITEAMTDALFSDEDINATLDELGLLDFAQGGIASLKDGGMLDFGGREMDLRGGGFVPMGKKERADDVPARLSKNEFVMTADAVRAAGGGSVNKGAQRMYDIMNRLEARA